MITSIEIENFRGIRTGRLDGLAPLTILTGPNGCGKSSVLDALLIGSSPTPGDAIGRAVRRHSQGMGGTRWLFLDRRQQAGIHLASSDLDSYTRKLEWLDLLSPAEELESLARKHAPGPYRQITCFAENLIATTFFAFDNRYVAREAVSPKLARVVQLVDSSMPKPLARSFSEIWRQGKRDELMALIRPLVPDLQSIDILTEDDESPLLYLTRPFGAVPVSLSGDGIQALIQIALDLALVPSGGLALMEEPEVYLHPRAIYSCADALLESIRQGRQIVLTTHSLELIDAILGKCTDDSLLALFNLRLVDRELQSTISQGAEMRFVRNQIEDDLRS